MKLYLIGLMGSGKSVLGKKISQAVQLPFIDLDEVIEKEEGIKVSEIFSSNGEEYFRKIEAAALREQSKAIEFVMATGGGAPCFHDNMDFMNQSGTTIFLNTSIQNILTRMDVQEKKLRPILSTVPDEQLERTLTSLLQKRLCFYQQAHITVDNTISVGEILQHINIRN